MEKMSKSHSNKCCVVGCRTTYAYRGPGVHLYSFPSLPWTKELKQRWIKAVNLKNADGSEWKPKPWSKVCSLHFEGGKRSNIHSQVNSVPTIFPDITSTVEISGRVNITSKLTKSSRRTSKKPTRKAVSNQNRVEESNEKPRDRRSEKFAPCLYSNDTVEFLILDSTEDDSSSSNYEDASLSESETEGEEIVETLGSDRVESIPQPEPESKRQSSTSGKQLTCIRKKNQQLLDEDSASAISVKQSQNKSWMRNPKIETASTTSDEETIPTLPCAAWLDQGASSSGRNKAEEYPAKRRREDAQPSASSDEVHTYNPVEKDPDKYSDEVELHESEMVEVNGEADDLRQRLAGTLTTVSKLNIEVETLKSEKAKIELESRKRLRSATLRIAKLKQRVMRLESDVDIYRKRSQKECKTKSQLTEAISIIEELEGQVKWLRSKKEDGIEQLDCMDSINLVDLESKCESSLTDVHPDDEQKFLDMC